MERRIRWPLTRIVATIGPASGDPEMIGRLIDAGVAVFRINFSHGNRAEHEEWLGVIRSLAGERPVAVLGDLPGPKLRVGHVVEGGIELLTGSEVVFQRAPIVADGLRRPVRFATNFERFVDDVASGHRVLVNDGAVRMLVVDKGADEITCRVTTGGIVSTSKGINLPDTRIGLEPLTSRDFELVEWAVDHDVDFLALSFVECARDVRKLIDLLEGHRAARGAPKRISVVAKIERPAAVADIEAIAATADGIMVARGDLGVELDIARVPATQRRIVRVAQSYGTPCIVATQMLESMIERSSPTRAEVSDVATAILDGVDAVMLSGETAIGAHPALAVEIMARIAMETEREVAAGPPLHSAPARLVESRYHTAALAHGAWTVAQDLDAACIVVWSQHGGGARLLSQNDFAIPIIALSDDARALRQMQLLRGVTPVHMDRPADLRALTELIDRWLVEAGWARAGETVLVVAGEPIGIPKVTNRLAIHVVGDPKSGFGAGR